MSMTQHQELRLRVKEKLYQKAKLIFSLADFDLRKWVTNCRELQAYFDENEKSFWLPSNLKKDDTNFTVS